VNILVGFDEKNISIFLHELRSPISTLLSIIGEVKANLYSRSEIEKSLEKIEGVASYMLSLSNNYLEISKNENACITSSETSFNFLDVLKYVIGIFDFQFSLKNIEFTKEIKNCDVVVKGDSIKVKQILINLLSNCFKYTPSFGKSSLYCEGRSISDEEVEFTIVVADNGIGMSEEFLNKLFTPYQCENYDLTAKSIGLGLSIIKENIDSLNGRIKVESKINCGTRFEIKLPLKIDKKKYDFSKKRILIIDDCVITKKVLENYLSSTKAKVDFASSGEDGLKKYLDSKPNYYNLIILDYHLGYHDGENITRIIRSQNRTDSKKIKIIGISSSAYDKDIDRCLSAGMDKYLIKPLDKYNLLNVISMI